MCFLIKFNTFDAKHDVVDCLDDIYGYTGD